MTRLRSTPSRMLLLLAALGALVPVGLGGRTSGQDWELRLHRSIGEMDGPLAFGRIGAIAANDTLVAIADQQACEAVIYHTGKGQFVSRWGGCGGGPGEFRAITAMAWHADSLFVADQRGHAISVLGPTGSEVRRIQPDVGEFVVRINHVGFADDTTLILGVALPPSAVVRGRPDEEFHSFVALVDARNGELRARLLEDSDSESVNNGLMAVRDTRICTGRGDRRGMISVLNPWHFRGTILRVGDTERDRIEFERDVPGFQPKRGDPGEWYRVGYPSIGCGDEAVMFKWIRPREEGHLPTGGYFELRDYEGNLLAQRPLTPEDSAHFGTIRASFGNRFYSVSQITFEVPMVLEHVFEGEAH